MVVLAALFTLGAFAQPLPALAGELDEAGRLFSGRPLPPGSPLAEKFLKHPLYVAYAAGLNVNWTRYKARTLEPVRAFAKTELPLAPPLVFYPFSGPDILNALSFFPAAKSFVLVGLEEIGEVPQPHAMPAPFTLLGLGLARGPINQILGLNFFRTVDIQTELRAHPYNGTAGLMLFFLSLLGCDVLDGRRIAVGPDGVAVDFRGQTRFDHVWGVELRFRPPGAKDVRTVYYFQSDLSDLPFTAHLGFIRFLAARGEMVTFLKAASHLMFEPQFTEIRDTILGRSQVVVQDASGVPFKHFEDGAWDLKLYGGYRQPIALFQEYVQPNLRAAISAKSRGPLPFLFGYDRHRASSHLIVATRRPRSIDGR